MFLRLPLALALALAASAAPAADARSRPDPAPSVTASPQPMATPTPGPMAALRWRNVGPAVAGGRLAAVAGSPADPALAYLGSAGGGVWKSTNGMSSWKPVFDKAGVGSIGAIAVADKDARDVWVGTGEANPRNDVSYGDGVYRSRDGGKTWKRLGLENTYAISKIALDPRDPNVAVVAALGDPFRDSDDRGVYRTTDGGATWTKTLALGPDSGAADLDRSAREPNVLFASMWQFRRSSWHLDSGGERDGLFRSGDGGATWKRVSGGGFASGITGRIGVAIAPSDPKRVYAIVESAQGLLWRSDDGGTTWRMTSDNTLIDERPFYYSRVFVDPANRDHAFATSVKLAETTDGGTTWQLSGKRLHGDHHAVWFANDGRTVYEANDGGAGISRDGGATWEWRNDVPIGQAYRVALDAREPYGICVGLQDNGSWCGPSDDRSEAGILARDWDKVDGGDGNFTVPDPLDPDRVWSSSGGGDNAGALQRYDRRTRLSLDVSPYERNQNVVPPSELRYRFNWEAPLAFSPFDGRVAYYAGDALFRTSDGGMHWRTISPDLTRDVKARQTLSGTPLRLDVTGAETFDTILDVAPSPVAAGEIWIATDDGRVQLTRDEGAHWRDVTMPGADMDARVPTIEASHRDPATAYAVVDRHFTGDRTAYVYATHDYGRSWSSIASGLPAGQFARVVREDPNAPDVLFLGLENSVWWSADRGASWHALQQNLPPASVRDLRVAPARHDLVAATHGRGVWVLDDVRPLEAMTTVRPEGTLFAPGTAYAYAYATPTVNARGSGEGPPDRALFTFYQAKPSATPPRLEILDPGGRVVRRLAGTHDVDGEDEPVVTNVPGLNRVGWDVTGEPPAGWLRAPRWNRGPERGADLVPGSYTVRLVLSSATRTQPLAVAADPRARPSAGRLAAHVRVESERVDALGRIDRALNEIDHLHVQTAQRFGPASAATVSPAAPVVSPPASVVAPDSARARALALQTERDADALAARMTSHPVNSQDNDFLRDLTRERIQSLLASSSVLGPTAEQSRESAVVRREANDELAAYAAFAKTAYPALQLALAASGLPAIDFTAVPPPHKAGGAKVDEHAERRGDE